MNNSKKNNYSRSLILVTLQVQLYFVGLAAVHSLVCPPKSLWLPVRHHSLILNWDRCFVIHLVVILILDKRIQRLTIMLWVCNVLNLAQPWILKLGARIWINNYKSTTEHSKNISITMINLSTWNTWDKNIQILGFR